MIDYRYVFPTSDILIFINKLQKQQELGLWILSGYKNGQ